VETPAGSNMHYPLTVRPRKTYVGMAQRSNMLTAGGRYRGDWSPSHGGECGGPTELLTFGNSVFIEPAISGVVNVSIDGYRWLDPYTSPANRDFLTDYGSDWMQWFTICHVNRRVEVYVPRQEGTMSPPTDERDEAWLSLVQWDDFMHEEAREHNLGS